MPTDTQSAAQTAVKVADNDPVFMKIRDLVYQASGIYRIKKIYPGENWNAELRSPLTEPGINVKEGDYLLAVNGRSLRAPQDPYELFVNTANETVTLTVNSKPSEEGSRNVQVKPINDEYNLRELNMITIGFCSILIGLGVDFGMLLYGSYQTNRNAGEDHERAVEAAVRQLGRGIFFGAITTAAAFACLALSECAAFAQLGVLIAIGISLAGLFMMTVFFVFVGARHVPSEHDWFFYATQRYVRSVFKTPLRVLSSTALLLAGLSILAIAPVGKLSIESNPRTLEPHDSRAGFALRKIQEKMPGARIEPVLVIVESNDAQEFHDRWELLQKHWSGLVEHGDIKGFNAPGVFALETKAAGESSS